MVAEASGFAWKNFSCLGFSPGFPLQSGHNSLIKANKTTAWTQVQNDGSFLFCAFYAITNHTNYPNPTGPDCLLEGVVIFAQLELSQVEDRVGN